jgi:hypothetical protein
MQEVRVVTIDEEFEELQKSRVKAHTSKTKTGKLTRVKEYSRAGTESKMNSEFTISSKVIDTNNFYGVSSVPVKMKANEVKLKNYPDVDLIVYRAKSGWIAKDRKTGETIGKKRGGVGWYGFDTAEEAVINFIKV